MTSAKDEKSTRLWLGHPSLIRSQMQASDQHVDVCDDRALPVGEAAGHKVSHALRRAQAHEGSFVYLVRGAFRQDPEMHVVKGSLMNPGVKLD